MSGRIFSSFKWKTRSESWWCEEVLCNIQTCTSRRMLFCGLRHCLLDLQAGLQAHLTHLSGFAKVKIHLTRTNASIAGHQARLRQLAVEAARPHEPTEVVKRRAHGLGVCVAQAFPLQDADFHFYVCKPLNWLLLCNGNASHWCRSPLSKVCFGGNWSGWPPSWTCWGPRVNA